MTEAIADYIGREYSKEMRLLVKNQKEKRTQRTGIAGQGRGEVAICDEEVQNRVETILLQERKKDMRSTKQRYL
jgi:hypothetical protein